MTLPPPSLGTKPSRSASNGRDARSGSSLRLVMAFMAQNPAMVSGTMIASAPPAIIRSASPRSITLKASPMAWLPVAHAVTTEVFGPLAPKRMEMRPDAMLTISIGMRNGETRSGPFSCRMCSPSSNVVMPPMPEPTIVPKRAASTLARSSPASWTAMTAQATAYWR